MAVRQHPLGGSISLYVVTMMLGIVGDGVVGLAVVGTADVGTVVVVGANEVGADDDVG